MARIAVVTGDVLGDRMAGPAIRALNIADQLARDHDVTLITTAGGTVGGDRFRCVAATRAGLRDAIGSADVVVLQGYVSHDAPWLLRSHKVIIVDLYDPLHLEQLEQSRHLSPKGRQAAVDLTVRVLNEQILRADLLLCASEVQRQFWIGHLAALGRVNVTTYDQDPTLRSLLAVCPFGLPSEPPIQARSPVRDDLAISSTDKVVLWAGGVYDWLDPLTAIRAVDQLRHRRPNIRLVFQGMKHPNPDVAPMAMPARCRRLSDELGLTGSHVFFNHEWVPYDQRQDHLLDADLGLSTHADHLEAQFAVRARILDYLWAGLPVVASTGDALAALVDDEGLGAVVPPGDVDGLARSLETLLYDDEALSSARHNVANIRERFTWARTLAPLVVFCADPKRAADAGEDRERLVRRPVLPSSGLPRLVARAGLAMRRGGLREVGTRGLQRVRRGTG